MEYRRLGRTGLSVSVIGFGAGPISGLMVAEPSDEQVACVACALQHGINWFDTAATYGDGRSEQNLGASLRALGQLDTVHLATKVRLIGDELGDISGAIRRSVAASCARLGVNSVTLLQLHNGVTSVRDEIPTSLTVDDVLSNNGVATTFEALRREGVVRHLGLTGTGTAAAMRTVLRSGRFDTLQIPFNLANPSASMGMPSQFQETDYGELLTDCERLNLGVFAIRVYAGGALLESVPRRHTYHTKFFPLDLYQRDLRRAANIRPSLPPGMSLAEAALRFAIRPPVVTSALVGFSAPGEIDEAVAFSARGGLPAALAAALAEQAAAMSSDRSG